VNELNLHGVDLFGEPVKRTVTGPLSERFLFPPFSVLDMRTSQWQERREAWLSTGIQGELGRLCKGKNAWNDLSINPREADTTKRMAEIGDGPTIFDPVIAEIAYRWFCPAGGKILDPFAGGSSRGIVAGLLARHYWGIELRQEQVLANRVQAETIQPEILPVWQCGDSLQMLKDAPQADLIFSCPPYGNLEQYSEDPLDLSAMEWKGFFEAYHAIIRLAVNRLNPDSFACFIVGEFRSDEGFYRNLTSATAMCFEDAGAHLYNEAILIQPCGSAAMRATRQFNGGRKLVKVHQNMLVFCKGDWRNAARKCGNV